MRGHLIGAATVLACTTVVLGVRVFALALVGVDVGGRGTQVHVVARRGV